MSRCTITLHRPISTWSCQVPRRGMSVTNGTLGIIRAAQSGDKEGVLEYLGQGVCVDRINRNGLTSLHVAAKAGHLEMIGLLLSHGADIGKPTNKGNTALHIASLAGQTLIVTDLILNGADVNVQSTAGFTPLYMAAQENHEDIVKYLLDHGANQMLATEDGFTPLAVALQQGHRQAVATLLEHDSKIYVRPALDEAATIQHNTEVAVTIECSSILIDNNETSATCGSWFSTALKTLRRRVASLASKGVAAVYRTDKYVNSREQQREKEMDSVSPLEGLPAELLREVIGYAPNAVFNLRLASRLLRSRVDAYAVEQWTDTERLTKMPIVQELTLTIKRLKSGVHVYLSMDIPKCHARLFDLRIIRRSPFNFTQMIARNANSGQVSTHDLEIDVTAADERMCECLGEYMGDRIGKVTVSIYEFHGPALGLVTKLLNGIQFEELRFKTEFMSRGTADYLLRLVRSHSVDNLSLDVERSGIGFENTAELLRALSFLVRKLHMFQHAALGISEQGAFFFGVQGADWAPIIIDMLSSRCDTLKLVNLHHKGYLPERAADELKEKLPLIGKQLWFEASYFYHTGRTPIHLRHNNNEIEGN